MPGTSPARAGRRRLRDLFAEEHEVEMCRRVQGAKETPSAAAGRLSGGASQAPGEQSERRGGLAGSLVSASTTCPSWSMAR
jgi:hypothetical protein